jgi:DeoR/GlpR family transcriptional regulator of sugar metabolism
MFPEIIGPVCAEAAIRLFNDEELGAELVTPHAILQRENLERYYERTERGWRIRWQEACASLELPFALDREHPALSRRLPRRLGFVIAFAEHEWYGTMAAAMQDYVHRLGIDHEIIEADQGLKGEIELCRTEIARSAASNVKEGDVILIDAGPISALLARELLRASGVTVVTNSMAVLETLQANEQIILIGVGGALRPGSRVFVGPTAEAMLKEMRISKLFLMATGVSLGFGVSHAVISEVTIKQAMIRAAREIVLLADHTCFGKEELIQVAPLSAIHKIITDDALPASTRLELSKQGIQVVLATM